MKKLLIFMLLVAASVYGQQTNNLPGYTKAKLTSSDLVGNNTNSGTIWGNTNSQIYFRDSSGSPFSYIRGLWDSAAGHFKWVSGFYNGSSFLETSLFPWGLTNRFGATWFSINGTNATISASQSITFSTNVNLNAYATNGLRYAFPDASPTNGQGLMWTNSQWTLFTLTSSGSGNGTFTIPVMTANEVTTGSSYEIQDAFLKLKSFKDFSLYSRVIGTNDSEFGWTWMNRSKLGATNDEDTTVSNAAIISVNADNTDWNNSGNHSAPFRYKTFKPNYQTRTLIARVSANADANYEYGGILIARSDNLDVFVKLLLGYDSGRGDDKVSILSQVNGGADFVDAISIAEMTAGIWLMIIIESDGTISTWYNSYSLTDLLPTTGWTSISYARDAMGGRDTLLAGQMLQPVNTEGNLTTTYHYWDDSGMGEFDSFGTALPNWSAQGYNTSNPAITLKQNEDLGSATAIINQAEIRNLLYDAVNNLEGDAADWTFSVIQAATNNAPAGTYYSALDIVVSGTGRKGNVFAKCLSDGTESASIKLSIPIPIVSDTGSTNSYVTIGNTLFVDQIYGLNSAALPDILGQNKMYADPWTAVTNATSGDTIVVLNGSYFKDVATGDVNLYKDGVTWNVYSGVTITATNAALFLGTNGTCTVLGDGSFVSYAAIPVNLSGCSFFMQGNNLSRTDFASTDAPAITMTNSVSQVLLRGTMFGNVKVEGTGGAFMEINTFRPKTALSGFSKGFWVTGNSTNVFKVLNNINVSSVGSGGLFEGGTNYVHVPSSKYFYVESTAGRTFYQSDYSEGHVTSAGVSEPIRISGGDLICDINKAIPYNVTNSPCVSISGGTLHLKDSYLFSGYTNGTIFGSGGKIVFIGGNSIVNTNSATTEPITASSNIDLGGRGTTYLNKGSNPPPNTTLLFGTLGIDAEAE